jgi:hypothetical protein
MDDPVVPPWVGLSPERESYLVPTLWQRQKRRWSKSMQTYWLSSPVRRATPISDAIPWSLRSVIMSPIGFFNERCTLVWHQGKAHTVLRWPISDSWEVWVSRVSSGATFMFSRRAQCIPHLSTQEVSEAPDWYGSGRHHPTGTGLDLQAYPAKILQQKDRVTRRKTTRFYKV